MKAQRSYQAPRYSGRVLLIQSEENLPNYAIRDRWAELATGRLDHLIVLDTTHRDLLLRGSYTPMLAAILREHLDAALAESRSDEPAILPFNQASAASAQERRAA
jgi:hypothetical protein